LPTPTDQPQSHAAELQIRLFQEIADRLERIEQKQDAEAVSSGNYRERLTKVEVIADQANTEAKAAKAAAQVAHDKAHTLETKVAPIFAVIVMVATAAISWVFERFGGGGSNS
jgi:hypothetical protein